MRDSNRATRWLYASLPLILACAPACSSSDNGGEALTSMGGSGGAGGTTTPSPGGANAGGVPSPGSGVSIATGGSAFASGGAPGTTTTSTSSMGGAASGGASGAANAPGTGGSTMSNGGQSAGGGGATASGGASGVAGAAGAGGATTSTPCDGKTGTDSAMLRAGTEYGAVKYSLATSNHIVDLKTVLEVPKKPTSMGTLFIWPGLQWLGGTDPARLGNGILQPVLTWGGSCNPMQPKDYMSWWIAAMYVNVSTSAAGPTGCAGGGAMNVQPAELLDIDMSLTGTTWKQVVTDEQTSKSVDFSIDLKGQAQDWATFAIELPMGGGNVVPPEDVVFTDTVLTFASPATTCQPNQRGPNDYFSAPQASADGLRCCIAKITLRAKGVAATTMP